LIKDLQRRGEKGMEVEPKRQKILGKDAFNEQHLTRFCRLTAVLKFYESYSSSYPLAQL
jgi:hypothetical protein